MIEPAFDPHASSGGFEGDWASQLAGLLDVVLCLLLITILATAIQAFQIRRLPRLLEMREQQAALRVEVEASLGKQGVSGLNVVEEGQVQRLGLSEAVLFPLGSAALDARGRRVVLAVGEVVSRFQDRLQSVEVVGHTDSSPVARDADYQDNLGLSALRAAEAVRVLEQQGLIDRTKLSAVGRADYEPGRFESDRDRRRVELRLIYRIEDGR